MKLFNIVFIILTLFFNLNVHAAEVDKEKHADIEKLIEMTGGLAIGKQMSDFVVNNITNTVKSVRPDLPAELFDAITEEVNGVIEESIPAYLSLIIPLYSKHFTHDEIKGLINFYNTELGKKSIRTMPLLVQESMALGQQWGKALAPEIQKRVKERFKSEGVDLSA